MPFNHHELRALMALLLTEGIGDVNAKKLIAYCGSAEEVFKTTPSKISSIPGIGQYVSSCLRKSESFERADEEISFIQNNNIKPITFLDEEYPARLKHCNDAPAILYFRGNGDLNKGHMLGIVGTRKATSYGKDLTYSLVEELKQYGVTIVSGLAYGIDVYAHKASLDFDIPTIGVVGHSLDRMYPAAHASVAIKMEENGGVLSEFMSGTKPDAENFPKRNRIVAGICDAVIVVEAGIKGGALITAEIANSYNRDVFAVPGRIGDTYSEGCNYLIRSHKAALLDSAAELAFMMGWTDEKKKKVVQQSMFPELNEDEKKIVNLLKEKGSLNIDDLCIISQVPVTKAASVLLNMEFAGIIKSLPGKIYTLS